MTARRGLRLRSLALLLCAAAVTPAAADVPWVGVWAPPQAMACTEDVMVYDEVALASESAWCEITAMTALPGLGAWALQLECQHEGSVYPMERLLMYDDYADELWEWYGSGISDPVRLQRCAG